jgi:LacI family transcriptional regulator
MTVRMKDIAKELGLSTVTVSKVFNNHTDISPATRERVLRRMRELNYKPSLHARGLATGHSSMIGLIVPDLVHAYFSEVAKSLSQVLRQKGLGLLIADSDEDVELENQEIEQMMRRQVDALIVVSCQPDAQHLRKVQDQDFPLILIDRRFDELKANYVGTDNVLVGDMATEHLINIGRRKIAHICGKNVSTSRDRLTGYRNALARHGIEVPKNFVVSRDLGDKFGDTTGREAMQKLLALRTCPDAVFCYNDPAAIGAMNAIISAGLRIPEDIAVIGSGNIRYAESFRVPLSSIEVSSVAMGEEAGKLVFDVVDQKRKTRPKSVLIRPKLLVRDSSVRGAKHGAESSSNRP